MRRCCFFTIAIVDARLLLMLLRRWQRAWRYAARRDARRYVKSHDEQKSAPRVVALRGYDALRVMGIEDARCCCCYKMVLPPCRQHYYYDAMSIMPAINYVYGYAVCLHA